MLAQERYNKIQELLILNNAVRVSELTKLFDVSLETVRRDLEYMESQGMLKRVHGGAILMENSEIQSSRTKRQNVLVDQKREIGEIVARYITEGDSIAMDASTTNHIIASVLKTKFKKLTIFTNYLPIVNELADMQNYDIIIPGGILNTEELSITGDLTEQSIGKYRMSKMLMSVSGISLKDGLTDFGFGEFQIKKKMMEISQEIYVVADSTKFGKVSLIKVCDFDDINMIITDKKLKDNIKQSFIKEGIEVINS